jgi:hypothetical protein
MKAVWFYKEHFKTFCEAFVVEFYSYIEAYITYNNILNIYMFGKLIILKLKVIFLGDFSFVNCIKYF